MKKLNITKEQFNKSNYFTKKYGKLEYVNESGSLYKTNKGKVLMFKESSDGGKSRIERLCANLEKQYDTLTYDEIEGKLKEAGFVLDEYGGKTNAYAVFVHDCGIVVNLEYRFVKDYGTRDSWHAADVTYFGWYDDPEYQRWSTESTEKFGRMFKESTDGLKNLIDEIFDDGLYEDGKKAQILLSKLEAKLNDLGLLEDENVKDYFDEFTQTIKICLKSSRIQNFYRDKAYRIADGLKYSIDSALGYTESTKKFGKKFKESFGMGFGDRFCDCESDPIEYNGQTYDTWTMYSGDDEIGDVMFADDALRQDMEENGVDPQIMEMVDLWVNPSDKVEDAIDQIIGGDTYMESKKFGKKFHKMDESMNWNGVSDKFIDNDNVQFTRKCPSCGKPHSIIVHIRDMEDGCSAYDKGASIQDAFPNFSPDEREFFMSGVCPDCW